MLTMRQRLFLSATALMAWSTTFACTNFIVAKGASVDGSVMCTYSADDYGMFQSLNFMPAADYADGEMRQIYDGDTHAYHGAIPEAAHTYSVMGNINQFQVTIGETTFGGREEMVDSTGIIDYGSLMDIALQRSTTAREAISVMTSLAEKYGYNSEGETFTICDPDEAWIMEMMGCGAGSKSVVWVALRIPDNAICAHANQSRIRHFNMADTANVRCSANVVSYARSMGWYDGDDNDFSFCDAYAPADFSGRRHCEARVWAFFNHFADMSPYIDYAEGKVEGAEPMPLWIVPDSLLGVGDLERCMRDHFEGTPFALDSDIGGGIWDMPYRPTPLSFEVDGKKCFNERPTSTQQSGFVYVAQMRSWLPDEIGGVLWFANDDSNMVPFTPVYCCGTRAPLCYATPGADGVTFNPDNAFWVCNWVSNMVYPRYSLMFESLRQVRDSLDNFYLSTQTALEQRAQELYNSDPSVARDFLEQYSCDMAQDMLTQWKQLAIYLIVKYNDMTVKPEENGVFLRDENGMPQRVARPGYTERFARELIKQTGDKFLVP